MMRSRSPLSYRLLVCLLLALIPLSPTSAQETSITVNDVAWSQDGNQLAVVTWRGVTLYKAGADGFERMWSAQIPTDSVYANVVAFSPSGNPLVLGTVRGATSAGPGWVYLWSTQTGELIKSFIGNESGVYALAFSPDGHWLAVGGGEWWIPIRGYIRIFDVQEYSENTWMRIDGRGGIIQALTFSPDGRWFVYSTERGVTTFVDVTTWTLVTAIYEETNRLAFDPTESTSTYLRLGQRAEVWNLRETPETHLVRTSQYRPLFEDFNASNTPVLIGYTATRYVRATSDGVLSAGDFAGNELVSMHAADGQRFREAIYSPDETQVALIGGKTIDRSSIPADQVWVWTLASGEFQPLDLSPE